jgi:tRNA guanosine-2'-O-methyltransferase
MDWMHVTEVPIPRIEAFLADKKAQGYTVVGLEQAQHSVPLERCVFPEKVVLVLGNEAKGIPVKLIQQLDVCVEIPQVRPWIAMDSHGLGGIGCSLVGAFWWACALAVR